jgi:hypothetical protein
MTTLKGVLTIGGVKFWWANGIWHVRIGRSTAILSCLEAESVEKQIKDYLDAEAS